MKAVGKTTRKHRRQQKAGKPRHKLIGGRTGTKAYHAALNGPTEGQSHVSINPHIDMKTATGELQPGWLASQTDLLATDWEIAD